MGAASLLVFGSCKQRAAILANRRWKLQSRRWRYMAGLLAFMVVGIMEGYIFSDRWSRLQAETLNAALLENVVRSWPADLGYYFVLITLASEAAPLLVAAQTGFLDGPRVLSTWRLTAGSHLFCHAERPAGKPERHPHHGRHITGHDVILSGGRYGSSSRSTASRVRHPSPFPARHGASLVGTGRQQEAKWHKRFEH